MTKLTKSIKDAIVSRCVADFSKEKHKTIQQKEHDYALMAYREVFDKKIRAIVDKLPDEWKRMDGCLRFNCQGANIYLYLTGNMKVAVPPRNHCSVLGTVSQELSEKIIESKQDADDLRKESRELSRQIFSILNSVTTAKKLQAVWPEGEKFYSELLGEKTVSGVPAVAIADLNKKLGI